MSSERTGQNWAGFSLSDGEEIWINPEEVIYVRSSTDVGSQSVVGMSSGESASLMESVDEVFDEIDRVEMNREADRIRGGAKR